jgi:hypothetical protein
MYQLRKYTLKDRESLDFYRNVVRVSAVSVTA